MNGCVAIAEELRLFFGLWTNDLTGCHDRVFDSLVSMKRLKLSGFPTSLSRIGLGCMRLSPAREQESFSLLETYLNAGGNVLDTAEIYGGGQSETSIGDYLKRSGRRNEAFVVTKGCVEPHLVRPDYISGAIHGSLERLRIDAIDLYLLHRDDPSVPVSELVDVLNEAVSRGEIRAFGGSNWTPRRLAEANRYAAEYGKCGFLASSPHLALATPREPWWGGCTHATPEDVQWYRDNEVVVLAWSSQCRGFFSKDSITDTGYLAELVRVYYGRENLEKRRRLQLLANKYDVTPGQMAVAYVISLKAPTIALVGPLSVAELVTLLEADRLDLSDAELAWLELTASTSTPDGVQ